MMGASTIVSISLGTVLVAGRKRVPRPAAGITAFFTLDIAPKLSQNLGLETSLKKASHFEIKGGIYWAFFGSECHFMIISL